MVKYNCNPVCALVFLPVKTMHIIWLTRPQKMFFISKIEIEHQKMRLYIPMMIYRRNSLIINGL